MSAVDSNGTLTKKEYRLAVLLAVLIPIVAITCSIYMVSLGLSWLLALWILFSLWLALLHYRKYEEENGVTIFNWQKFLNMGCWGILALLLMLPIIYSSFVTHPLRYLYRKLR